MSQTEIDHIGPQPLQRALDRAHHVPARQTLSVPGRYAKFGGEHNSFAPTAALREPGADDRLGFPGGVPGGINVGRIEEVEATVNERVEQAKCCGLINGPAEHIAPKRPRGHHQAGSAELLSTHWCLSLSSLTAIELQDRCVGAEWARSELTLAYQLESRMHANEPHIRTLVKSSHRSTARSPKAWTKDPVSSCPDRRAPNCAPRR